MRLNFLALCLGVLTSLDASSATYQDGDLIFHESQSAQSKAIREATDSKWSHVGILFSRSGKWYVIEAVQPVRFTRLDSTTWKPATELYTRIL